MSISKGTMPIALHTTKPRTALYLIHRESRTIDRRMAYYANTEEAFRGAMRMLKALEAKLIMAENQKWEVENRMQHCIHIFDLYTPCGFLIANASINEKDRIGPFYGKENLSGLLGHVSEEEMSKYDN